MIKKKHVAEYVPKEYWIKVITGESVKSFIIIADRIEIVNGSILFYRDTFILSAVFPVNSFIIEKIEFLKT